MRSIVLRTKDAQALGALFYLSRQKPSGTPRRVVSLTFDDGLKSAADIAMPILQEFGYAATFYIVTGWVHPARARIRETYNAGRDHGTWDYWRDVAHRGHEVGSHGYRHINARGRLASLFPWLVESDIVQSAKDLQRELPGEKFTISMPWNSATRRSEERVKRWFSACRLGSGSVEYNNLQDLKHSQLSSWAPNPSDEWQIYSDAIRNIPESGWLILQFHSFEDEGWQPISADLLRSICETARGEGIEVDTVGNVVSRTS